LLDALGVVEGFEVVEDRGAELVADGQVVRWWIQASLRLGVAQKASTAALS
jgi:hypothetical protein